MSDAHFQYAYIVGESQEVSRAVTSIQQKVDTRGGGGDGLHQLLVNIFMLISQNSELY